MPESPEISFLKNKLQKYVKNQTITQTHIRRGRYATHGPPKNFNKVENQKVQKIHKKGKKLALELHNGYYIIISLGLFGWLFIKDKNTQYEKHDSVVFKINDNYNLIFNDKVSFGSIVIARSLPFDEIAPDIMDTNTTFNIFQKRLYKKGKNKRLCKILLEQSASKGIISGIGNYLKAESLYMARLSPFRICSSLNTHEQYQLFVSLKDRSFTSDDFLVYKQDFDPNGYKVIKDNTCDTSRTTYWVPNVQN